MKKIMLTLLLAIGAAAANAADDKPVKGTYTYRGTPDMTLTQVRERALAGAQTEALREAFGTLVVQDVMQSNDIRDDKEMQNFLSSTQSTVKGEWLSTTNGPFFSNETIEDGCPSSTCTVEGRARELSNAVPALTAKVLNGQNKQAVCSSFTAEDDIYMYVHSPERDVYVLICLESQDGTVTRLFPYIHSTQKLTLFEKGYDYILFDDDRNKDRFKEQIFGEVDNFWMQAERLELDRVYVIYSPNFIRKGPWTHYSDQEADTMPAKDFNKWMLDMRRADDEMGMKVINISVRPKSDFLYDEEQN